VTTKGGRDPAVLQTGRNGADDPLMRRSPDETPTETIDRQLQRIGGELVLTTPKAEKARPIVVPGVVAVELRRHLRDHHADGLLFQGRRGTPADSVVLRHLVAGG